MSGRNSSYSRVVTGLSRRRGPDIRRGAILPLMAVTLIGMMALIALAVDGSEVQRQRRLAQNAADAGALAGAQEILRTHSQTVAFAAADSAARRNGFVTGVNGARVIVSQPASPDFYTGPSYVKVVVEDTIRTLFARIINRPLILIKARAWGGIIAPSGNCLVSLNPTDDEALRIYDNGTTIDARNCGVQVNSNDPNGFKCCTNATLDVTGGSLKVNNGPGTAPSGVTGPYSTGVAPITDPMAYLTMPSFSHTCNFTNMTVNTVGTTVLSPGTYCGGISVKNNGVNVQFSAGVYYLLGGGLGVESGASVTSTGTGVTFVNTWDATHDYGKINLQSAATVTLSANTDVTNPLAGVLFYQDPSVPASNEGMLPGAANVFKSGSGSTLTGTIYFPTQDVEFSSGSTMSIVGGVIAQSIWIHSGTDLTFTPQGTAGTDAYYTGKRASIVE
jgi:hypothetical protein